MSEEKQDLPQEEQAEPILRDDQGRRVLDETGQPIHWATKSERVIALVLALIVVGITIAMAYAIAVGDFFHW